VAAICGGRRKTLRFCATCWYDRDVQTPPSNPFSNGQTAVKTNLATTDGAVIQRSCQLSILSGAKEGLVVQIDGPRFVVGKEDGSDLVLPDPTVSRQHFVIEMRENTFVIRDEGSTNGTWIENLRIKEAFLRPGMQVRAGDVELRVDPIYKNVSVEPSDADRFGNLVGRSVRMRQVFTMLERVARTNATVVLIGETGSGKSAVARAIHDASPRRNGPFITVDCGAIAESLIESELFGHARGAFTGAVSARKGALELAQGGTLFIDELVDLNQELQPRLLRVLEEREVRRVGSNETISLDVRIIAASRYDLWKEVQAGRFREDLYFRLSVFQIPLPSLRERPEDIPLLTTEFTKAAEGGETLLPRLTPQVLARLAQHPFYGNVRELRNVVERAIFLGTDPTEGLGPSSGGPPVPTGLPVHAPAPVPAMPPPAVGGPTPTTQVSQSGPAEPAPVPSVPEAAPLPPVPPPPAGQAPAPVALQAPGMDAVDWSQPFKHAKEALLDTFEAEYLKRLLQRCAGMSASAIAREAGIDRKHLYNLAKKHNINLQDAKK